MTSVREGRDSAAASRRLRPKGSLTSNRIRHGPRPEQSNTSPLGALSDGDESPVTHGQRRRLAQAPLREAPTEYLVVVERAAALRTHERPGRHDRGWRSTRHDWLWSVTVSTALMKPTHRDIFDAHPNRVEGFPAGAATSPTAQFESPKGGRSAEHNVSRTMDLGKPPPSVTTLTWPTAWLGRDAPARR